MIYEKAETDWLASESIFYNEKLGIISNCINEVIDYGNLCFHPEGLNNYLQFGYSVLGQTLIKDVKFLQANQKIYKNDRGKIIVEDKQDPVEEKIGIESRSEDVFDYMAYVIERECQKARKKIILPLSGGWDSRLLAHFCPRKQDILAFTYGISKESSHSSEVLLAKRTAENLQIRWEEIKLGKYHTLLDEWDKLYGVATHAHGMYQMEFYQKILKDIPADEGTVLSGIIGDAWAGTVYVDRIKGIEDFVKLGYTHGINADLSCSNLSCTYELREEFFVKNRERLKDRNWNVVFAMRNKLLLLSYLLKIPQVLGMTTVQPFLDLDLAIKMVNLPWSEKEGRKWQRDYLEKHHLLFENDMGFMDRTNMLDLKALLNVPLRPLDANLLSEVIRKDYVEWININVGKKPILYGKARSISGKVKNAIGMVYDKKILKAYSGYLVLKPIENLLKRRL